MALSKLTVAILILTLTIVFESRYIEGRRLKQRTVHKNTSGELQSRHGATYAHEALLTKPMAQLPPTQLQPPPPPHRTEDFRPTAPVTFEARFVEGRHLKQRTVQKNPSGKVKGRNGTTYAQEALLTKPMAQIPPIQSQTKSTVESQMQPPSPPHGADDFRPTAPGHSPGLILAILILTLIIAYEIQNGEGRHLKHRPGYKNTYVTEKSRHGVTYANEVLVTKPIAQTPSTPSHTKSTVESQVQSPPPSHGADVFRPTAPGHSPGVGHAIHN
ncbi:putative encoded peptide [Tanacetum coccineum]